jgi:hypothetical protein
MSLWKKLSNFFSFNRSEIFVQTKVKKSASSQLASSELEIFLKKHPQPKFPPKILVTNRVLVP